MYDISVLKNNIEYKYISFLEKQSACIALNHT